MRRFFTILIVSLLCVSLHAQKKLFQNALAEGRQPNKFYLLHNDKSKMVRLKDLMEYAAENGYIVGKSSGKEISRFGDVDTSISTLEFLPIIEYESYIYCNIKPDNNVDFSQISSQGSAYCFFGWDNSGGPFSRLDGINWSGRVSNGLLEGSGVGYIRQNTDKIIFVEGTFEEGFPTEATRTTVYNMRGKYDAYSSGNVISVSTKVGKMSDGMAMIEKNGVFGFVDNKGKISITPKYKKVIQEFWNGQAIVEDNGKETIIDRYGAFVDYSPHQKQLDEEAAAAVRRQKAKAKEQYELAEKYLNGDGVEENVDEAIRLFMLSAEAGYDESQLLLGAMYYGGFGLDENKSKAVEYFQLSADQGNDEAMLFLGGAYMEGGGVGKDEQKAISLYRASAEKGNGDAMNRLGYAYEHGIVVTEDKEQAVKWYRKGAEKGSSAAMYNLAVCYEYGNGVGKDISEALEWYQKAADNGDEDAPEDVRRLGGGKKTQAKGATAQEKKGTSQQQKGNRWVVVSSDDIVTISYDTNITTTKSGYHIVWVKAEYHTSEWQNYFAEQIGKRTPVASTRTKAQFSANYSDVMVRQVLCFDKAGKQMYDSGDDTSAGWGAVNASDPVGIVGEYLGDKMR